MVSKVAVFLGLFVVLADAKPKKKKDEDDMWGSGWGSAMNPWSAMPSMGDMDFKWWKPYVEGTKAISSANVKAAHDMAEATKEINQANSEVFSASKEFWDSATGPGYEFGKQAMDSTAMLTNVAAQQGEEMQRETTENLKASSEVLQVATEAVAEGYHQASEETSVESKLFQAKMVFMGAVSSLAMALSTMLVSIGTFISASMSWMASSLMGLFTFGAIAQTSMDVPAQPAKPVPHKGAAQEEALAQGGFTWTNPWEAWGTFANTYGAVPTGKLPVKTMEAIPEESESVAATPKEQPKPAGFLQVRQSSDGELKTIRRH
eukprot:gnl/MRDRNA2_/MRDRNA2_66661_c0_seq1.p1 gnl/MRDRNA2_/MRDRNA2_66661_c0~~gnl/MRDRNA2_/MRDRNA2_66661_c0_seq1.p1  ORF type:complete len:319 (+),score=79.96 gnl/MRDRNA2_/MRDRNA2_66661_c0_seq1:176-1132(+)